MLSTPSRNRKAGSNPLSSVNAHFRPMIAPLMFAFAVKRLVDSANAAAGKSPQFFERFD